MMLFDLQFTGIAGLGRPIANNLTIPVKAMDKLHQQWIADLVTFRGVPRTQSIDPKTLVAVNEVIQRLADRIKTLANRS
jgi:hypothetical protein